MSVSRSSGRPWTSASTLLQRGPEADDEERSMAVKDDVPTGGTAESRYRWVIVGAGGILGCVAIGAMFSLPVFLLPISRDTGWSVTGVSSAMTIGFVALALARGGWGTLADRIGTPPGVPIGSIGLAARPAPAGRGTALL